MFCTWSTSMFYTYVIENKNGNRYIGFTNDLKKRIIEHNNNETYTSRRLKGPWKIIYYEDCANKLDAHQREKYLKSGRGWAYLKRRLHYYIQ